jgi:hypothetical protein
MTNIHKSLRDLCGEGYILELAHVGSEGNSRVPYIWNLAKYTREDIKIDHRNDVQWKGEIPELSDEDREEIAADCKGMNYFGNSSLSGFESADGDMGDKDGCNVTREFAEAFDKHIRPLLGKQKRGVVLIPSEVKTLADFAEWYGEK